MGRKVWAHIAEEPDAPGVLGEALDARVRVTTGHEPPEDAAYQILVAGVPERKLVEASPALEALVIPWSGVPNRTRALMAEFPDVAVHNLHHNALQVAEMTMALLLSAAKRVVPMDRDLRRGDWSARYEESEVVLLDGKNALILGYGAIGRIVAPMCQGLGMTVTAVRRGLSEKVQEDGVSVHPPGDFEELLPGADALIVCLPLTDETRGLVGERELSLMPPRAILVNVGRGSIVEEAALYEALRSGTLHAAGLDVWYNYPKEEADRTSTPPSSYPFHELDNVVMSPHRGGAPNTAETEAARMRELAELLNAAARGEPLPNPVDIERGY